MIRILYKNTGEIYELCESETITELNELFILDITDNSIIEKIHNSSKFHIDIKTKEVVIDELKAKEETEEERLTKELLDAKSEIVDLKYKELIENKERMDK